MSEANRFEEVRRQVAQRARVIEETAKGAEALRRLRFRRARHHLTQALEMDPDFRRAKRLLLAVRVGLPLFSVAVALIAVFVGWFTFLLVTVWGPTIWSREAPTPTPVPTATATRTPLPPTRTQTPKVRVTATRVIQVSPSPTPLAVTIQVLQTRLTGEIASVEFKVFEEGVNVEGLRSGDVILTHAGLRIPFSLQERSADDPVCVVVAVDNSGSILPGLTQIREAIRGLNDRRKPGDELGLVVFAEPDRVRVMQEPSELPLDESVVTGEGQLTALWDGMLEGLEQAQKCSVETRYLIVLTDGADTGSVRLAGDDIDRAVSVATLAKEGRVGVCTVGVESDSLKEEPLELAAYACRYEQASQFDELAALFQGLFGSVRHFYRVEFSAEEFPLEQGAVSLRVLNSDETAVEFGE
jgi:hypothetical protein